MLERRIFHLTESFLEDLTHDWTIEEMAARFELSAPHFRKLFKQQTGMPPMAYLRDLRLRMFQEILLEGYTPIKVIGAKVGLFDETHLSRDYKNPRLRPE